MPGVGIGVILLNDNMQVLLLLRNDDKDIADSDMRLEGTWTLPSGKIWENEKIEVAAIRKVKEETNLDINDIDVVSIADDINEYAHFVTIGLIANEIKGKIELQSSGEHVSYKYFDLKNLPKNTCLPTIKIINNYLDKVIYRNEEI